MNKMEHITPEITNKVIEKTKGKGDSIFGSPSIPSALYKQLPALLKDCSAEFTNIRDRDVFLTGALSILSGCMPTISGTYSRQTVFANLFSFIIAPPASGKGALAYARMLAADFDQNLIDESNAKQKKYKQDLFNYRSSAQHEVSDSGDSPEMPQQPKFRSLFAPADASSAAIFEHLEQNDGMALICETEADTMANSLKQEWGSYSDMLRKSFHHEPISRRRKGYTNIFQVSAPRISVALSGTPSQVTGLINSTDDGLFSRFIFYTFQSDPVWQDVSPQAGSNLSERFQQYSLKVTEMIYFLQEYPAIFTLADHQWDILNKTFAVWLPKLFITDGPDTASSLKRLGLICFRIAMILSAVERFNDGVIDPEIICEDKNFDTAFILTEIYLEHMLLMHKSLPRTHQNKISQSMQSFYQSLPDEIEFQRKDAIVIGSSLKLSYRTVDNFLNKFKESCLIELIRTGIYKKVSTS